MKVSVKFVYVVACIVVVSAYLYFLDYSFAEWREYDDIRRAESIAREGSPDFYDKYEREGFGMTVYGRNVVNVGLALMFAGLISTFLLAAIWKSKT